MIVNIRDEINKIIATSCYTEEDKPEDSVIMGEDFSQLADDLVKFCNLHFVSEHAEPKTLTTKQGFKLLKKQIKRSKTKSDINYCFDVAKQNKRLMTAGQINIINEMIKTKINQIKE